MKKTVFCCLFIVFFVPFVGISQEKPVQKKDKNGVVVLAQNPDGPMILCVINGRYYLGDTTAALIRRLDFSKVKKIEEVKDKERRAVYGRETGKFSDRIREIFFIETDEKFEQKLTPNEK